MNTIKEPIFKVTESNIQPKAIYVLQHTAEVLCFNIDFKQKYFYHTGYSNGSFFFCDQKPTLRIVEPQIESTIINISNLDDDWYEVNESSQKVLNYNILISVSIGSFQATIFMVKKDPGKAYRIKV